MPAFDANLEALNKANPGKVNQKMVLDLKTNTLSPANWEKIDKMGRTESIPSWADRDMIKSIESNEKKGLTNIA